MLQEAKNEGLTIKVRHAKILFCGASKAGKTSFSRLLRNQKHETDYKSTPAGESQQVLISEKVNVVGTNWVELDCKLEAKNIIDRLILKMRNNPDTSEIPTSNQMATQPIVREDKQPTETEVEMAMHTGNLIAPISELKMSETWDLVTLLDTGGQPEFINLLPAINASTAITFIVLDISEGRECLDKPVVAQYNSEGYSNYCKCDLKYTTIHLLKCLLSSVKVAATRDGFCPDFGFIEKIPGKVDSQPVVRIMGTQVDLLERKFGKKYKEELSEINKRIKDEVEQINKQNILKFLIDDDGKYITPIDNTIPRDPEKIYKPRTTQHKTKEKIQNIRQEASTILSEKAQYEIPITWFILELELRKSENVCIHLSEVQKICNSIMPPHKILNIDQITEILKFYHNCGTLLYFWEVEGMKDFVITNPQWLFTNLTKLMMCKFEDKFSYHDANDKKKLQNGICCTEYFKKLVNEPDLHGIKLESFIKLLIYLKIIAPLGSEYFIPNILPLCTITNDFLNNYGTTAAFKQDGQCIASEIQPLLIEFSFGTVPRGLFGFLIVQLLQDNLHSYAIDGENDYEKNIFCRCSDMIIFSKNSWWFVTIIDKISYLELQIRTQNEKASCHCEVQEAVTEALKTVCTQFQWKFNDCRYGFLCQSKICSSQKKPEHLSLLSDKEPIPENIPNITQCKYKRTIEMEIDKQIWFKVCT